jgi:hypothetical protein
VVLLREVDVDAGVLAQCPDPGALACRGWRGRYRARPAGFPGPGRPAPAPDALQSVTRRGAVAQHMLRSRRSAVPTWAPRFIMGQASVCELAVANRFARLRLSQASIAAMITIMTVTSSAICHVRSQTVGAASACGLIRGAAQVELVRPAGVNPLSTRRSTPVHPSAGAPGQRGGLR